VSYRLVFTDEPEESPCPDEIWETREEAEDGRTYWEKDSGKQLEIVED